MTMKSVGSAALKLVEGVRRQFNTKYATCVKVSTDASLREMIPAGALVMLTSLIAGTFFGLETLTGFLVDSLVSIIALLRTRRLLWINFQSFSLGVLFDWSQAWGFTSSPSVGEFLVSLAVD
jgi:hypothetical protein